MNTTILNKEHQEFITQHLETDIPSLLLKKRIFKGTTIQELIGQIEAKKKCNLKLPHWYTTKNIYYPSKLNIEQSSSEIAANYKAQLINGSTLLDATGGFGVDSYFFSKNFNKVTFCEIDNSLAEITAHNYKMLNVANVDIIPQDSILYLKRTKTHFDWIYVDPSRRNPNKGKVFLLADCNPDILENLELIFKHTKNVLLKTSPMLDLTAGIGSLKFTKEIHIVAIENEVKELLWILDRDCNTANDIIIKTVNIKSEFQQTFSFNLKEELKATVNYSLPKTYIYEPNAAVLKSGAFNKIAEQLGVSKLHKHSHLYTSYDLIDFPGRSFKIVELIPYTRKLQKKDLSIEKANITVRNFPVTVRQLRHKFKIADGGDWYLFFTTICNNQKMIILSEKVKTKV